MNNKSHSKNKNKSKKPKKQKRKKKIGTRKNNNKNKNRNKKNTSSTTAVVPESINSNTACNVLNSNVYGNEFNDSYIPALKPRIYQYV